MRMPRAIATFNRRVTNPAARSITPWLPGLGTLEHVGRNSGTVIERPSWSSRPEMASSS